jgi:hypothetical protein
MGINAQLRTEDGQILVDIDDAQMVLSRATKSRLAGTRLLKYLVPWGDAVFNQSQASDLADDIRIICDGEDESTLSQHLKSVQPLVDQLSEEAHLYLWFVGD